MASPCGESGKGNTSLKGTDGFSPRNGQQQKNGNTSAIRRKHDLFGDGYISDPLFMVVGDLQLGEKKVTA